MTKVSDISEGIWKLPPWAHRQPSTHLTGCTVGHICNTFQSIGTWPFASLPSCCPKWSATLCSWQLRQKSGWRSTSLDTQSCPSEQTMLAFIVPVCRYHGARPRILQSRCPLCSLSPEAAGLGAPAAAEPDQLQVNQFLQYMHYSIQSILAGKLCFRETVF